MRYLDEFNDWVKTIPKPRQDEVRILINEMQRAQPWFLASELVEFIGHTEMPPEALLGVRLPHPSMLIEFYAPQKDLQTQADHQRVISHKRIVLVVDMPQIESITLTVAFHTTSSNEWILVPIAVCLPYTAIDTTDRWLSIGEQDGVKRIAMRTGEKHQPTFFPALPLFADWFKEQIAAKTLDEMATDVIEEVAVTLSLLALLNCDNVETETLAAKPLTKKQAKQRRRLAPRDYKTIRLTPADRQSTTAARTSASGKRTVSPHWRRGHIRNQPTKKGIVRKWLKPMFIRGDTMAEPAQPKAVRVR